ncbi:MAG: tetratricopeptide repeat protein [Muribaculaceae bacterium]|nr:tetratricopeptide repeat protein [Muribaculaceae bacterium]
MKATKYILSAVLACSSVVIYAQKGLDAPMTKAVMNVYQKLLDEDPKDYETYFHRANEYYKYNEYLKALDDINNALKYTPGNETDMRFQEYSLRANIYEMLKKYDDALADLNSAAALNPASYVTLYQRANVKYNLGRYSEAKSDYQRMQRINNRSQEALIGLARVAVKENNLGLANEYIDQAVAMTPSQSDIYVRRASVRTMMGNYNGAVDDLILAISTDKNNTKALQEIVDLSNTNYSAVMTGLSNAIRQAPKVGMFYYLRAVIASTHHNYLAAISDFNKIINENLYNYHGLYGSLAECHYALGNYTEALNDINYAIGATTNNRDYYVLKAKIKRATGNYEDALDCADKALKKDINHNPAIIEKALALCDAKNYDDASALFGEAILNDAENSYYYMLRAWVLKDFMNQGNNANSFYERAAELDVFNNNVRTLKGFSLLHQGKKDKAIKWIEDILAGLRDSDGLEHYYATCLYAWSGDYDKAFEYMKIALQNGYANYHQWKNDNDARINVAPLRKDPRFETLLNQFSIIFQQ